MKHLLSLGDLSDQDLDALTVPADDGAPTRALHGTLGLLFQQPSLRTRSSFAAAGARLGLAPVAIASTEGDALRDRADLADEVHQLSMTSNCVVVRAKATLDASLRDRAECPVVNAGDGSNEHPTQTLIDLTAARLHGLKEHHRVVLMGNLRDHRVHHSLHKALKRLGITTSLVSPPELELPYEFDGPRSLRVATQSAKEVDSALAEADFIYLTPLEYFNQRESPMLPVFSLDKSRASRVLRPTARVLHPFPRFRELSTDLDDTPFNAYFDQTRSAVDVRHRILSMLLR